MFGDPQMFQCSHEEMVSMESCHIIVVVHQAATCSKPVVGPAWGLNASL
jgi:hypothetical protein